LPATPGSPVAPAGPGTVGTGTIIVEGVLTGAGLSQAVKIKPENNVKNIIELFIGYPFKKIMTWLDRY
jgi:hypothetical protein